MIRAFLLAGSLGLLGTVIPSGVAIASTPVPPPDPHPLIASNDLGQVTSVSQLSDVQPTDWAFQALQSLVERYGCIAGYPDGTFRGNRAATRFELAAALNACLDSLDARFATPADLDSLRALQNEFAAELATLRGRVDALEARTKTLEAQQFSTTTKLDGDAIIAAQGGDFGGTGRPTIISRVRLNLNTSFSGDDLLFTQLEFGNSGQDIIGVATADSPFGDFSAPGSVDFADVPQTVTLAKLYYTFKPTPNLAVTVGPLVDLSDFVDANSYANDEIVDFSSGFFINNPLIITSAATGAGAVLDWNINGGPFSLRAAYVAANATNAIANEFGGGLFGDPYQGTIEAEYATEFAKNRSFALRLQYTNAAISDVEFNNFGVNTEVTLGRFGLFGRFGYGDFNGFGSQAEVDFNAIAFAAGIGLRDLVKEGTLLGLGVGQPFIEESVGNASQTNFEAFFNFPVNDNISVTPALLVITNANNDSQSPTVFQGILRTVFVF